jgi:hypothetical protein
MKRLLKPNGSLIVGSSNFKSFDAKHYGFWAAYDVPIHFGIFKNKKHFDKKGCNWKSAPDEI